MLERERLESKKISKTNAVTSIMGHKLPADDVYIGPSDYVPWLTDRKWAHIRVEGQAFGDVPLNVEMKLEVWDSPNSAGIVIDAVRCCKLALNNGVGGQLDGPSSYLMKSPMNQRPDDQAREETEKFIAQHARTQADGREAREEGRPRRSPRRASDRRRTRPLGRHGRAMTARPVPEPLSHRAGHAVRVGVRARGQRATSTASPASCAARGHAVRRRRAVARRSEPRPRRRARRCAPRTSAFGPTASVLAVGEVLPELPGARAAARPALPVDVARTVEELLDARAARHRATSTSRSRRRVAERRAAPLARAQRRHVPRARRAARLHPGRAQGRRARLRPARRAARELRARPPS